MVLGANGFIGSRLVRALLGTADLRPVALVRSGQVNLPAGVDRRRADARSPTALRAAVAGASYAVNCVGGPPSTMLAATRALCDVAGKTGLRIVHLSSMAVYGDATGLVGEAHPVVSEGGGYAQAKADCERIVSALPNAVILRPGCVHGPGSEQWTGRIGRLLRQHRIGDLGAGGDGGCNLTFVDDLVAAILATLRQPAAGGVFNVSDPDPGTWNDYFRRLGFAIGAVPIRRISDRWLRLEGRLAAPPLKAAQIAASRLRVPLPLPDPIPPSLLRLWQQDIILDHRRADAALGFHRTDPAQAIAAAAAWVAGSKDATRPR